MTIAIVAASLVLAVFVFQLLHLRNRRRQQRLPAGAAAAGITLDERGNINPSVTFANLLAREAITGEKLTGKQAEFRDLLRMVMEGPASIDEIRYLIREGYEPMVRPDGKVYVPCEENEHLYMDGELPLAEADLEPCRNVEL